jgi:hypothetical protein
MYRPISSMLSFIGSLDSLLDVFDKRLMDFQIFLSTGHASDSKQRHIVED